MTKKQKLAATNLLSGSCAAFLAYWEELRGDALLPSTERVIDTLPPKLAPESYILEVTETQSLVRFQGTGLMRSWGVDLTGEDLCAKRSKRLQSLTHGLMKTLVGQPCGYICRATYTTSHGRDVAANAIRPPVAVQPGRPPRILSYKDEDRVLEEAEASWRKFETPGQEWFDIGAGVPSEPPVLLVE